MVHIARTTPIVSEVEHSLANFDEDVIDCFQRACGVVVSEGALEQVRMSLSMGGLGLRSVRRHHSSAYLASYMKSLPTHLNEKVFTDAHKHFERELKTDFPIDKNNVRGLSQKSLSDRLEKCDYQALLEKASPADKVRIECVSAPHSAGWLRAVPAARPFNMVLEPNQASAALKHRLGLAQTDDNSSCSSCVKKKIIPEKLDRLGHHALTCKYHGYVTARHNDLARSFVKICSRAHLPSKLEQGAEDRDLSRPADVLLSSFSGALDAALDFTVVSPLTHENITGAVVAGHRAELCVESAEKRKHEKNDEKCKDNKWLCVPMAVDTYGVWGKEAREMIGQVGDQLASQLNMSRSSSISFIYNVLGVVLARKNANALLAKSPVAKFGKSDVVVLGAGENNNSMERENERDTLFSSVRVSCVQNPRRVAQQLAPVPVDEIFNAVEGVYNDVDAAMDLSEDDASPVVALAPFVSPIVPYPNVVISNSEGLDWSA